jgi:hypothetical protein
MIFLLLILVPVAALLWLGVVSHGRIPKRAGAAAAAVVTMVGAVSAPAFDPGNLSNYRISGTREAAALLATSVGSLYLLIWPQMHQGRGVNRTLATIAAIIGLVPILAAAAAAIYAAD